MRLVPSGEFLMGSENGREDERPVHKVYLDSFYIDKYEVTNALYKACVDARTCDSPKQASSNIHSIYYGNPEFDNYPVIFIGWNMAKTYCEWRGARLPTEAEWEKAARGTDGRTYPWGEEINPTYANYGYNVGDTTPVGFYERGKSTYGVYDTVGNAWEWVNDWYGKTYYQSSSTSNPLGAESGQYRVLRGGSWYINKDDVRSSSRFGGDPEESFYVGIGFRCARSP